MTKSTKILQDESERVQLELLPKLAKRDDLEVVSITPAKRFFAKFMVAIITFTKGSDEFEKVLLLSGANFIFEPSDEQPGEDEDGTRYFFTLPKKATFRCLCKFDYNYKIKDKGLLAKVKKIVDQKEHETALEELGFQKDEQYVLYADGNNIQITDVYICQSNSTCRMLQEVDGSPSYCW